MIRNTISILFAAVWLLSQSAAAYAVLCCSADGGVFIEPAIQEKCPCPSDSASRSSDLGIEHSGDPCRDLPLSLTTILKDQGRNHMAVLAAERILHAPLLPDRLQEVQEILFASPPQALLNTVILII